MQFSYRVSEADYRTAFKLRIKSGFGGNTVKVAMFWVFILVCLLMLWAVVSRSTQPQSQDADSITAQASSDSQPARNQTSVARSLVVNVASFAAIAAVWGFMIFRLRRWTPRHLYLRDPAMQGEYTISVTPATLSIENTAGFSTQSNWSLCESWREGKGIIIILNKSGTYFPISTASLSEAQLDEFRSILGSVLMKK